MHYSALHHKNDNYNNNWEIQIITSDYVSVYADHAIDSA